MEQFEVAVLMASYNGREWLPEQLSSILSQCDVNVTLYISDDISQDESYAYLEQASLQDHRIKLLPSKHRLGSAGKNFYRLILDSEIAKYDYVAFADQDDIWMPDKLIRHIRLLNAHGAEGVSSSVKAFWPNGRTKLINKAQPQRQLDYLFESAGPGCTFLITPWLVEKVKQELSDSTSIALNVALHDWLAYAICRSSGRTWLIDSTPSVQYRQHSHNVLGANSGFKAKFARFKKISDGWYRQEVKKVVQVCMKHSDSQRIAYLYQCLNSPGFLSRMKLLRYACQARRGFYDRIFLSISILLGVF